MSTPEPDSMDWMPQAWCDELALISIAAIRAGVQPEFIAAIRKAENGQHPYNAFGVISLPLTERDTYAKQLRICCESVAHRLSEFSMTRQAVKLYIRPQGGRRLVYSDTFISYFRNLWAPPAALNDPHNLNENWVFNVTAAYYLGIEGNSA